MQYQDVFPPNLVLESDRVLLRNLSAADEPALWELARDPELFTWFNRHLQHREELQAWIREAATHQSQQVRFPFVVIDKRDGRVAGSTSLGNISFPDQRIEIGWTWYGSPYRGTGINLHCKFLLLQYAFDTLQFERVEIKTDALNARSRAAIRKLGMTEEGILRSHMAMPGGRRRDSVYYSLLRAEWPAAKSSLLQAL